MDGWTDRMGMDHDRWEPYRSHGIASVIERDGIRSDRSIERIERIADGMQWMDRIVPLVDGRIERMIDGIARSFRVDGGILRDRTIDDLASWIGSMDADERRARMRGIRCTECDHPTIAGCRDHRWIMSARRIARRIVVKLPSGGGSMPSLDGSFERAEGTGSWMDDDGDPAPSIGIPHPYGMPAPFLPERDAIPHRSIVDAITDADDRHLIESIIDHIERTERSQRDRIEWDAVDDGRSRGFASNRHRSTIQRDARRIVRDAIRSIGMDDHRADGWIIDVDARIPSIPDRHRCADGCDHARSVVGGYSSIDEIIERERDAVRQSRRAAMIDDDDESTIDEPYDPCAHEWDDRCECSARMDRAIIDHGMRMDWYVTRVPA